MPRWELQDEPAIAERLYEELLQKITSDADGALRQVREIAIPTARRMLQWISRQRSRVAEAEVEAALRQRVREKVKERDRQYIKFLYGSKDAFHLHLRDVLRNCSINSLHPAAELRVSERFAPQVQSLLFNYTVVAKEAAAEAQLQELLEPCMCRSALKAVAQDDQLRQWLHDGHVCTTDLKALKWPYKV